MNGAFRAVAIPSVKLGDELNLEHSQTTLIKFKYEKDFNQFR